MFSTVVTPATFDPNSGLFDELYALGVDGDKKPLFFATGVPLISGSKPGDRDYNGGRWRMNVLINSADAAKYKDAKSDADLTLSDFAPSGAYFECPLLPVRGNN